MKYKYLIITMLIMLISTAAFAGIWSSIKDVTSDKVIELVIAGVFFLASTFFGGVKIMKWRKSVSEIKDIFVVIYKSIQPDSPGGDKITKEEFENILAESGQAGAAILAAIKTKIPT